MLYYGDTCSLPLEQLSMDDIVFVIEQHQTQCNIAATSSALQSRLLFNMNRGKTTPPMQDIVDFLPFPAKYTIDKSKSKLKNVTRQAAIDYTLYFDKLPLKARSAFYEVHDALVDLSGLKK